MTEGNVAPALAGLMSATVRSSVTYSFSSNWIEASTPPVPCAALWSAASWKAVRNHSAGDERVLPPIVHGETMDRKRESLMSRRSFTGSDASAGSASASAASNPKTFIAVFVSRGECAVHSNEPYEGSSPARLPARVDGAHRRNFFFSPTLERNLSDKTSRPKAPRRRLGRVRKYFRQPIASAKFLRRQDPGREG